MFVERLRHFNIPVRHPDLKYYSFKNEDRFNVQFIVFELEKSLRTDNRVGGSEHASGRWRMVTAAMLPVLPPTKKMKLCLD